MRIKLSIIKMTLPIQCSFRCNQNAHRPYVLVDCAYLDTKCYDVHQATAWLPLLDATEQNGCMEVSHFLLV